MSKAQRETPNLPSLQTSACMAVGSPAVLTKPLWLANISTHVLTNLQHLEHGPCDIVIQGVVVPELLLKLHWLAQVPGLCQQLEQLQGLIKGRPLPLQAEAIT